MTIAYIQVSTAGHSVTLYGNTQYATQNAYCTISKDWVEGWYATPDPKVTITERGQGDGAHDITDESIQYSARTVTIHGTCVADNRDTLLEQFQQLLRFTHHTCKIRLVDEHTDTYITGHVTITSEPIWSQDYLPFTITIVAVRPERLNWTPYRVQLHAAATSDSGLQYGNNTNGLQYPLSYGVRATDARNTATLINHGSSRAYPILTVNGDFDSGILIDFPGTGAHLRYTQPIGDVPLVLDSRSRTATIGGLDVTRYLSARGFPVVQPYASVSAVLLSAGSGWVTCEVRDTYM